MTLPWWGWWRRAKFLHKVIKWITWNFHCYFVMRCTEWFFVRSEKISSNRTWTVQSFVACCFKTRPAVISKTYTKVSISVAARTFSFLESFIRLANDWHEWTFWVNTFCEKLDRSNVIAADLKGFRITARLFSPTVRVKVHVSNFLLQTESTVNEIGNVRVNNIDVVGVWLIQSYKLVSVGEERLRS